MARRARCGGSQEAAASDAAATRQAIAAIAAQFADGMRRRPRRGPSSRPRRSRDCCWTAWRATFPALCARYGEAEVRAIVRAVLPALTQEPAITVRAQSASPSAR